MFRKLYDWVLGWAERKNGPRALYLVSFAEASFFPVPPDPLLAALCLGNPKKSWRFGILCSLFSVLGALAGYLTGLLLWESVDGFFLSRVISAEAFDAVNSMYSENAFKAVLGAAFTPIPFKAFTLTAGVFGIDPLSFLAACALGRTARFMTVAAVLRVFGEKARALIERYFGAFTAAVFLLVLLAILLFGKTGFGG